MTGGRIVAAAPAISGWPVSETAADDAVVEQAGDGGPGLSHCCMKARDRFHEGVVPASGGQGLQPVGCLGHAPGPDRPGRALERVGGLDALPVAGGIADLAERHGRLVEEHAHDLTFQFGIVQGLPRQVVEIVYQDVDESLWGAAEWSVRAQLAYLATR